MIGWRWHEVWPIVSIKPWTPDSAERSIDDTLTGVQVLTEPVGLRFEDDIAIIVIRREHVRNAINDQALLLLENAVDEIRKRAVRVAVIAGEGKRAFSTGSDIKELASYTPARRAAHTSLGQSVLQGIEESPTPVIAAVEGYCLGGGLELALACDLRVAGRGARFGLPEVGLGGIPGWGGTFRLPRTVGVGRAREMILFGREVGASDALAWGLLSEVVPDGQALERATAVGLELAKKTDVETVARAKQLLAFGHDLPTGVANHLVYLADVVQSASNAFETGFAHFGVDTPSAGSGTTTTGGSSTDG